MVSSILCRWQVPGWWPFSGMIEPYGSSCILMRLRQRAPAINIDCNILFHHTIEPLDCNILFHHTTEPLDCNILFHHTKEPIAKL